MIFSLKDLLSRRNTFLMRLFFIEGRILRKTILQIHRWVKKSREAGMKAFVMMNISMQMSKKWKRRIDGEIGLHYLMLINRIGSLLVVGANIWQILAGKPNWVCFSWQLWEFDTRNFVSKFISEVLYQYMPNIIMHRLALRKSSSSKSVNHLLNRHLYQFLQFL